MNGLRLLSVVLTLLVTLHVSAFVRAAVVTNTNDSGAGSLRQAIASATIVDPIITFDTSLSGQIILLTSGELVVNHDFFFFIDATALPGGLTISGNNASRVFRIGAGASPVISGLTITGGSAGYGGGIRNNGNLILDRCTVSGNQASIQGGGIYSDYGSLGLSLTLTNVTLSANTAGGAGGGLYNQSGAGRLINSTISGNTAVNFGGGIANDSANANLTLENVIVAGNSGPSAGNGADIGNRNGGTVNAAGANLVGDNDTVAAGFPAGPLAGTTASPLDPLLAPLGDYGGPNVTRLLLAGSPAIDAAIATGTTPGTDARGFARPFGPASDLGAVEVTDSDGDGADDGYETAVLGTDPNNVDSDGDGLVDGAGGVVTLAAYPGGIDADGDGFVDGEQDLGTDPAVSNTGDLAPRGSPDDLIGPGDYLVLTRLVTGVIQPTVLESVLGDINGDTRLDVADLLLLLPAVLN
jgi:hypothetical protein